MQVHESELIEQVRSIMATTFDVDDAEISDDTSQDTCGFWTSLQHLMLMVAIEDRFRLRLTTDEMLAMKTLPTIVAIVRQRTERLAA